jgi:hypothetical protein
MPERPVMVFLGAPSPGDRDKSRLTQELYRLLVENFQSQLLGLDDIAMAFGVFVVHSQGHVWSDEETRPGFMALYDDGIRPEVLLRRLRKDQSAIADSYSAEDSAMSAEVDRIIERLEDGVPKLRQEMDEVRVRLRRLPAA